MKYNFDEIINRENTACYKYDLRKEIFGRTDVLPMWVADMDFRTPGFVIEALRKRLDHKILGYTFRTEGFNKAVATWLKKRHGWEIKNNWVAFSPGVVPALNLIILSLTRPGDRIIVQRPVYFPFFPAIESHGRVLVNNPLKLTDGRYQIDFDDLEKKLTPNTRMVMFCSPHNPTGNVWSREDLQKLTGICVKKGIIILSDEIHSDLILDGSKHIPTASLGKDVSDLTITCIAPSKTFNLAGLSTSVVITSNGSFKKSYDKMLEDIHVGGGNLFGFAALEAAYNSGEEWLGELLGYIGENLRFLVDFLSKNIPQIKPVIPQATYMVWLDCRQLGLDDTALKKLMVDEAGLGLSDGTLFGPEGSGFQRMNIGCPKSILAEALERLKKAVVERMKH
ncbi:MAG: PatB family C-S lyase [Bacteroidales bacterium]|nr:PatB family C-S lyase [Bacteroidales bacterium]